MFLTALVVIALVFFLFRSGRFGRGYHRGPWQQPGQPGAERKPDQPGWVGPWGPPPRPEDDALKVLADRLASGDITPEEYTQRVSVLRQQT